MTTYAHDPAASAIVSTWPTGDGAVACRVARVPRDLGDALARRITVVLTRLSAVLWSAYSEGEAGQLRPADLLATLRDPDRPPPDGDDERVRLVHALGRLLARTPGRAFRETVVREVRAELDAVLDADAGELTGRALQAVRYVRGDVHEGHVATADAVLEADPLEPVGLLTTVEPHSAAVAAVHWLRAAARWVAEVAGHSVADVVALAEAIEHEDLGVAREVLVMRQDEPDEEVVRDLLQEAVLAGRGIFVVCPDRPDPDTDHEHRVLTTVLHPLEPGRCLVDGLIRGIQGCFRVYADAMTTRERPGVDPSDPGHEWAVELRNRFVTELREEA
ncbi:hypothetical protein AD006_23785 [Pseudonocardia sp. EC080610-09]|uniref:hypothetical protein n=1 Tax=unclassified Pseudonocardia TaxID=2619320 RepID=UPI0006CB0E95|nr:MULTISPECIES: hypothetical protein [unclassified Pseudonocardia]ALE74160.1 hypothetical protein FRP1_16135 [Pseudonocardia sp. EC080625-04]ALL77574.1 hypothetical protein AD006_23785 [Pseudonocardia sp. EC080610-09]ALL80490.1 hypothetical protein AD017_03375 [Pseudonocardia sp. EC080619-01]